MLRKSRVLMAAGAASAAIAFTMAPTAAQAVTPALASCYASTCTGHPAASYTCVKDAEVIDSVNLYYSSTLVGNLQLKYSPSCRATWARVISYYDLGSDAAIISNKDFGPNEDCTGADVPNTGCNTTMIDDLSPLTSFARGDAYIGSTLASGYTVSF
jgi:Protein of unknown function (DUF2690)